MTSSIYNYQNTAKLWLPMTAEAHDPGNVRTLDLSGNGLHATFGDGATATTYPTKLSNRGYSMDGGDYLNVGDQTSLNFTTTGTVVLFFGAATETGTFKCLIAKQNWTTGNNGYSIWLDYPTPSIKLDLRNAISNNTITITNSQLPKLANFVAMTWTGSLLSGYYNGIKSTTPQIINPTYLGGIPFAVGSSPQNLLNYNYAGRIFFAGAWSTALSELQIRDLEARLRRQLNDV